MAHTDSPDPILTLLLTGATGQIGQRVLSAWCRQGHATVLALRDPARQWPALCERLRGEGVPTDGVRCVRTDLALPDLGWNAEAQAVLQSVNRVMHLGAQWGWGLDWAMAERVNVQGSLALHRWAVARQLPGPFVAVCGFLSRVPGQLAHLQRLGLRGDGVGAEALAQRLGPYEVSKVLAYLALQAQHDALGVVPITWIHPAAVIADPACPQVPAQSAIAGILQMLSQGRMPWVPGSATHRVPWVTGDYVARYTVALLEGPAAAADHVLLDPASPNLLDTARCLAQPLQVRAPMGHVPLSWFRALLSVPGVARLMGTSVESLSFIVDTLPDVSASLAWGEHHGVRHPDIHTALRCTAQAWAHQRSMS